MLARLTTTAVFLLLCSITFAAGEKAVLTAEEAGPDFVVQGEYEGQDEASKKVGVQVVALGDGKFDAYVLSGGLPGAGWDLKGRVKISGQTEGDSTSLSGEGWSGSITAGSLTLAGPDDAKVSAKKVERKSPTLGKQAPSGAVVLFDGSSVDAWEGGRFVEVAGEKYLGVGVRSREKMEDFTLHLEFRTPWMAASRGQSRGNSGMYLLNQYECQVLDSFGLDGAENECGGIYSVSRPDVNMCLPPLSWQTYDVEFTAAKFDDDGKRTADAVTTIRHNGVVIHDNRKLPKPTPGGGQNDDKAGPLFLQNHGDPVVFRNIWIVKK